LVPEAGEKYVSSPAAFMTEEIWPFFLEVMKDLSLRREMLATYFGTSFAKRNSGQKSQINEAFDAFTPDTFKNYPFTTAQLIVHFTYMRAPLIKIGPECQRNSLPYLIGRGKNAQFNNDSDEKYVAVGMVCDRILTCDEGMKNIAEVIRAGGNWQGEIVYFHPEESLMDQIPKLV
jgi:hypothetical protein